MPETLFTAATTAPARRRRGGRGRRRRGGRGSRGRRALRVLSSLLIVLGVVALADVGVTLVWQEPFSALYAQLQQDHLRGALHELERAAPDLGEQERLERLADEHRRVAYLAGQLARRATVGSAVGSIRIPRIGADFVLVYGTGTEELEQGPGIYTQSTYPGTRFPGLGATTAIAGHRTTFLEPFRHIDQLRHGDRIYVDMPYAHFVYTVLGHRSVPPTDVQAAIRAAGYSRLVLSACTPLFSAAERLLVFARLTKTVPVGAALGAPNLTRRSPPPQLRAPLPRLQA
ncbi:MAG TPA: class E sortase [Solirubrobacteraceae bacterium]|jgi:sortase A|nr:class E sortase [Solirubrobacteraceae bacterium]